MAFIQSLKFWCLFDSLKASSNDVRLDKSFLFDSVSLVCIRLWFVCARARRFSNSFHYDTDNKNENAADLT